MTFRSDATEGVWSPTQNVAVQTEANVVAIFSFTSVVFMILRTISEAAKNYLELCPKREGPTEWEDRLAISRRPARGSDTRCARSAPPLLRGGADLARAARV